MKDNVYVIGDSWSSGWNSDTNQDHQGWAQMLNIPAERNLAIAGSTAQEWATKYADKIKSIPEDAVVILSLGGNDMIKALSDGRIDPIEIINIGKSITDVFDILSSVNPSKVIVIRYENPFACRPDVDAVLGIYYSFLAIQLEILQERYKDSKEREVISPYVDLYADCFSNGDIHPNANGYKLIAEAVEAVISDAK